MSKEITVSKREKGLVKGYVFESVIKILLERNQFKEVQEDGYTVIQNRDNFIEIWGKGAKHQIDCPYFYPFAIPFVDRIRLLGEVKFHEKPIGKSVVREAIGTLKDVQDGQGLSRQMAEFSRYYIEPTTDFWIIISASGFVPEAWTLATAHGVKLISFENNFIVAEIKKKINELVDNIDVKATLSKINLFRNFLKNRLSINWIDDSNPFDLSVKAVEIIDSIQEELGKIKCCFWGFTKNQTFICFTSDKEFPRALINHAGVIMCELKEEASSSNLYYLTPLGSDVKFYFDFSKFSLEKSLMIHDDVDMVETLVQSDSGYDSVTLKWNISDLNKIPTSSDINANPLLSGPSTKLLN